MAGINNRREALVKDEAIKLGWEVLGRGWPDFILYNPDTDEIRCIEVKACKGYTRATKQQRRVHQLLKKLGVNVKIIHVGGNVEKHRKKVTQYLTEQDTK